MKRKLDKTELKLAKKGIKRREKQLKESCEALTIHKKHQEFIKIQREYEDLLKPYNRKIEDLNVLSKIEKFESDKRIAEKDIENLQDQIKNGVEVKKISGVD